MSKQEIAALNQDAVAFVRKVVTEIYGQRATKKTVAKAAKRVVAAIPTDRNVSVARESAAPSGRR
jgi:hypothetical protein